MELDRGSDDLVLVPEVEARRLLRDRRIRLRMLAPYGTWIGCGTLRVLRLKMPIDETCPERSRGTPGESEAEVELTVGYEAYRT